MGVSQDAATLSWPILAFHWAAGEHQPEQLLRGRIRNFVGEAD